MANERCVAVTIEEGEGDQREVTRRTAMIRDGGLSRDNIAELIVFALQDHCACDETLVCCIVCTAWEWGYIPDKSPLIRAVRQIERANERRKAKRQAVSDA